MNHQCAQPQLSISIAYQQSEHVNEEVEEVLQQQKLHTSTSPSMRARSRENCVRRAFLSSVRVVNAVSDVCMLAQCVLISVAVRSIEHSISAHA